MKFSYLFSTSCPLSLWIDLSWLSLSWSGMLRFSFRLVLGIPKSFWDSGGPFCNSMHWIGLGGWASGWFSLLFGSQFVVLLSALFYVIMTGKGIFLYLFYYLHL